MHNSTRHWCSRRLTPTRAQPLQPSFIIRLPCTVNFALQLYILSSWCQECAGNTLIRAAASDAATHDVFMNDSMLYYVFSIIAS